MKKLFFEKKTVPLYSMFPLQCISFVELWWQRWWWWWWWWRWWWSCINDADKPSSQHNDDVTQTAWGPQDGHGGSEHGVGTKFSLWQTVVSYSQNLLRWQQMWGPIHRAELSLPHDGHCRQPDIMLSGASHWRVYDLPAGSRLKSEGRGRVMFRGGTLARVTE